MARIAAIGELVAVQGYALAGAVVLAAGDAAAVRAAWRDLPGDVDVVILTRRAADALGDPSRRPVTPLTVVIPT
ncbi:MAG TPA: hypothetical protein VF054_18965 [Micromonosporaceae bacterium]